MIDHEIHLQQNLDDMQNLLKSGKHSDFVIIVGNTKFPVHKAILSARSPVFAAMFDHDHTKEVQEGKVQIVDVPANVIQLLLNYIYTGKLPGKNQLTGKLMAAADKV